MAKNYRTRLPKSYQDKIDEMSNTVPPGSEKDPDSFEMPTTQESEQPDTTQVDEQSSSTDWVDALTIEETPAVDTPVPPQDTNVSEVEEQQADESDEEYISRLRANFESMEHIDAEVASEIFDKAITPIVDRKTKQQEKELKALRDKVARLEETTNKVSNENQARYFSDVNTPIFSKYPKANIILKSKEFADFVNKDQNPHSPVTNMQILRRAYESGDSAYVISALDAFSESRTKPKPPVNADTSGKGSTAGESKAKNNKLSEAEFLAKRREIVNNPRKYPKGTLRVLEQEYFS